MAKIINEAADKLLDVTHQVLDHGSVTLIDYMGTDACIARAARVSTGSGARSPEDDARLIRYLMRHGHTSPFEMCELKFHCKMPIFVARQWIRHRTASVNEQSGRYSELACEYYLPDSSRLVKQSTENKQGSSDEPIDGVKIEKIADVWNEEFESDVHTYLVALKAGLTRELARIGLPLATYTQWIWKIDLHNLLHFLKLRLDTHAQYEIRAYAEIIAGIVQVCFPATFKAFDDYVLHAVRLSGPELQFIRSKVPLLADQIKTAICSHTHTPYAGSEFGTSGDLAELARALDPKDHADYAELLHSNRDRTSQSDE